MSTPQRATRADNRDSPALDMASAWSGTLTRKRRSKDHEGADDGSGLVRDCRLFTRVGVH